MRKRGKKTTSAQHFAWQYMRRNRTFRVGDVMSITEIKVMNIKGFLYLLEKNGYIKRANKTRTFIDRIYVLLKDSGVLSPTFNKEIR